MRSKKIQAGHRRSLIWYALGFVAIQAVLGVGVDAYWPAIRDPDFEDMRQIVADRMAKAPGRPLVLFFGSSRLKSDLRAEVLNRPQDQAAPLVINACSSGAGPIAQDVFLGRWLDAGIRPAVIFLEIIPMSLSVQDGATIEEPKNAHRYTAREAARIWPYYAQPIQLGMRWSQARGLPCHNNRAELRDALGLDVPASGASGRPSGRDDFGWCAPPGGFGREDMERYLQASLESYHLALTQPAVAPGAMEASRSFVNRCLKEGIKVMLILPPESSGFRYHSPTATASQVAAVRRLATELGVPLLDHSDWVDDDGFWDGHHTTAQGTEKYTRRFAKEVFEPMLATAFSSPPPRK